MRAHTQEQAEDDSVWQGALAQRNAREQAHERAQATAAEHNMMMMMRVLENMGQRRDAGLGKNAHGYLVQNGIAKEMRFITSRASLGVPAINRPRQPVLRRLRAPEPPHLPAGRTRHSVFECFPYVCPESVLVKYSLINGSQRPFWLTCAPARPASF
eukprot:COSAG06_NODE_8389_length_2188_cov_18.419818_3_plen_157_part_00